MDLLANTIVGGCLLLISLYIVTFYASVTFKIVKRYRARKKNRIRTVQLECPIPCWCAVCMDDQRSVADSLTTHGFRSQDMEAEARVLKRRIPVGDSFHG